MAKSETLYVFYQEFLVGRINKSKESTLHFSYELEWEKNEIGFELAPAMPFNGGIAHNNLVTRSFFEGLLPEGHSKDRINQLYKDITKDSFKFLEMFGEDCAGAFIISPKRDFPKQVDPHEVREILIEELDKALDNNQDLASYIHSRRFGRFSLAGAQDKIALIFHEDKLYIPTHGGASTHILKPAIKRFGNSVDTVFNELFVMRLAKATGLNVPDTFVIQGKYPYYLIERYDREVDEKGVVKRVHQYDCCQALGYLSENKYEEEGGPSFEDCFALIKEESSSAARDLMNMLKWLSFNLLLGNNDSHAKNISLIKHQDTVRLSPFYDLISTAIYPGINPRFAFGVGKSGRKQYYYYKMRSYHLENTAKNLGIRKEQLLSVLGEMMDLVSRAIPSVTAELAAELGDKLVFKKIANVAYKRIRLFKTNIYRDPKF